MSCDNFIFSFTNFDNISLYRCQRKLTNMIKNRFSTYFYCVDPIIFIKMYFIRLMHLIVIEIGISISAFQTVLVSALLKLITCKDTRYIVIVMEHFQLIQLVFESHKFEFKHMVKWVLALFRKKCEFVEHLTLELIGHDRTLCIILVHVWFLKINKFLNVFQVGQNRLQSDYYSIFDEGSD